MFRCRWEECEALSDPREDLVLGEDEPGLEFFGGRAELNQVGVADLMHIVQIKQNVLNIIIMEREYNVTYSMRAQFLESLGPNYVSINY